MRTNFLLLGLFFVLIFFLVQSCVFFRGPMKIEDVQRLPQDPHYYLDNRNLDRPYLLEPSQKIFSQKYLYRYFLPWHHQGPMASKTEILSDPLRLSKQEVYGENLRKRSPDWLNQLIDKCQMEHYPLVHKKAVTIRNTYVRMLPTDKPAFHDPKRAGQGYPFDSLQYSAIWANTPILISHISSGGAWYFGETAYVSGWLPAEDIAFVDKSFVERFENGPYLAVTEDSFSLVDFQNVFRFTARIGMLLPLSSSLEKSFICYAAANDHQNKAILKKVKISKKRAAVFPLAVSPRNLANIAKEMIGQIYGWGGMYQNRDCSATIRDYFSCFGLWLPRNSAKQAQQGQKISLTKVSDQEKEQILLVEGLPFLTLVCMPGHVMLYLGQYKDQAVVLHNLWGLKTWDLLSGEGRKIIGRTIITTLRPGQNLNNLVRPDGILLHRITSINILGR